MSDTLVSCPTCHTENFTPRGLKAHRCKGLNRSLPDGGDVPALSTSSDCEIVTAADDNSARLVDIAESIESSIDLVASHEDAFHESTLEHRLEIGLHIAQAQEIFTLSHSEISRLGGKSSGTVSTVDTVTPPAVTAGFSGWLYKTIPRLKRGRALHYAAAFRALDLPTSAKPADIRSKLKTLRHRAGKDNLPMPSLKGLAKAAPKIDAPEETTELIIPVSSKELRLGDARQFLAAIQDDWLKFVKSGNLDELPKRDLEALKEWIAGEMRDRITARLK
jgi:hypothetical protein